MIAGSTTWGGVVWGWEADYDRGGVGQAGCWEPVLLSWDLEDAAEWSRVGGGMTPEQWMMSGQMPAELWSKISDDADELAKDEEPDYDDTDFRRCGHD